MSAWQITRKDLLLLTKDKRAIVLLLVLPLLFIAIVGMATGQFLTRDDDSQRFRILVLDKDQSELSRSLVESLGKHREVLIQHATSPADARQAVQRGEASLLLSIGGQFEEKADDLRISDVFNTETGPLAGGLTALDLSVEGRPVSVGIGRLLEGLVFSQAVKTVAPVAARKNAMARNWIKRREQEGSDNPQTATSETSAPASSVQADLSSAGQRANEKKATAAYLWIVPGFTVMFAFFLVSIMGRSFIAERDHGTMRRLLLAPISSTSVLVGKTIPFYLTSLLQCGLLFVCGRLLFGMSWGADPVTLIPIILCTSLAATTLGLLLATIVKTDQQVSSYGTTLILLLSSLSGCFFPREMFPALMKRLSLCTPHGWALRGFDAALTQAPVDRLAVTQSCLMLILFAAVFFCCGWWRFEKTR